MRSTAHGVLLVSLLAMGCASPASTPDEEASALGEGFSGLDPRYGKDGVARGEDVPSGATTALAYDDSDRLLLLRSEFGEDDLLHVVRYDAAGKVDPSYRQRKPIPLTLAPEGGELHVQPLADGSAVVSVSALCALSDCPFDYDAPGKVSRYLFRLRADGDLDTTFASGKGFLTFPSPARKGTLATYGTQITRSPEGEVVIAVDQPKGAVDVSWLSPVGTVTKVVSTTGLEGETRSLAATSTQAVLGRAGYEADRYFGAVVGIDRKSGKTNPGMGRWTAYDPAGSLVTRVTATKGSVWVTGHADRKDTPFANDRVFVTKLGHDLLIDPSFGTGGTKTFDAGGGSGGELADLRERADGGVVIAGTVEAEGIFKLDASGTPSLRPGKDRQLAFFMLKKNGSMDTSLAKEGLVLVNAGSSSDRFLAISKGSTNVLAAGFSGRALILTKLFSR